MTKWDLYMKFESFIDNLFDKGDPSDDDLLELYLSRYSQVKDTIWCQDGHELVSDMCGKPEHDYCLYCEKRRENLE